VVVLGGLWQQQIRAGECAGRRHEQRERRIGIVLHSEKKRTVLKAGVQYIETLTKIQC